MAPSGVASSGNASKIANIVEVCNVSKDEAARVLEACNNDADMAIDRFLSGVESGWSEVSKKKKPAASSSTAYEGRGGGGRGGANSGHSESHHGDANGSGPSPAGSGPGRGHHGHHGHRSSGHPGHDRSSRYDRSGHSGSGSSSSGGGGRGYHDRDRPRGSSNYANGASAGSSHRGSSHQQQQTSATSERSSSQKHSVGVANGHSGAGAERPIANGSSSGFQGSMPSEPPTQPTDSWGAASPAPGADSWGAAPTAPAEDSWGTPPAASPGDAWGEPATGAPGTGTSATPSQPVSSGGKTAIDPAVAITPDAATGAAGSTSRQMSHGAGAQPPNGSLSASTQGQAAPTMPASGQQPQHKTTLPSQTVKRSFNYAAAAAAGTSHAKPIPAEPVQPVAASQPAATQSGAAPVLPQKALDATAVHGTPIKAHVQDPGVPGAAPVSSAVANVSPGSASTGTPMSSAPVPAPVNGGVLNGSQGAQPGAGESTEVKKRRNRGGRKHRARMEAMRAQQENADGAVPNGAPANGAVTMDGGKVSPAQPVAANGTGVGVDPVASGLADDTLQADVGAGAGVPDAPLKAPANPPNAWAARAAAKEKKEADDAAAVAAAAAVPSTAAQTTSATPANASATAATTLAAVAADSKTGGDALSLQFGSFGLGGVDWTPNDQPTSSKSIVNVAPVVVGGTPAAASAEATTTPQAPVVPSVASASSTQQTAAQPTGAASTTTSASPVAPSGDSAASSSLQSAAAAGSSPSASGAGAGLGSLASVPQGALGGPLGAAAAAAAGFPPGSYGAPSPYGMMPVAYPSGALAGYDAAAADLKGIPPQGLPYYDPATLAAGLPGAPGKFGTPGMGDMGLLATGAPTTGASKLPGMDMDKNGGPGPGAHSALHDMYMMGYPPQNVPYPALYGFAPAPYTAPLPPGSVPNPGGAPYGYNAYPPAQNGQMSGGKFNSSSGQQSGGRGGFGFEDSAVLGTGSSRSSGALGESMYMPMPGGYLGGPQQGDATTGGISGGPGSTGAGSAPSASGKSIGGASGGGSGPGSGGGAPGGASSDASFKGGRGGGPGSGAGSGQHVGGNPSHAQAAALQGMAYPGDYGMPAAAAVAAAAAAAANVNGWSDTSRSQQQQQQHGNGGVRDPMAAAAAVAAANAAAISQNSSGAGIYQPGPAPPTNGYWQQQQYY